MLHMRLLLSAGRIGILEAGVTALLGYAVVFFGLALLMAVVMAVVIGLLFLVEYRYGKDIEE